MLTTAHLQQKCTKACSLWPANAIHQHTKVPLLRCVCVLLSLEGIHHLAKHALLLAPLPLAGACHKHEKHLALHTRSRQHTEASHNLVVQDIFRELKSQESNTQKLGGR